MGREQNREGLERAGVRGVEGDRKYILEKGGVQKDLGV